MEIKISDYSVRLQNGATIYVCSNELDDGDVRLSVVASGCVLNVDLSVDELQRFCLLIRAAINEAFEVQPELRCPACGYSAADARLHGDHRLCRRYPFFPGEKGRTQAIG